MTCVPDFHQARSRAQVFHPLAIKHVDTSSSRCCFLWFGQRDCKSRLLASKLVYPTQVCAKAGKLKCKLPLPFDLKLSWLLGELKSTQIFISSNVGRGGGEDRGGLNLPLLAPFNPGSRTVFVGSCHFAFFRLRNIGQCCVIFPFFSRLPPPLLLSPVHPPPPVPPPPCPPAPCPPL